MARSIKPAAVKRRLRQASEKAAQAHEDLAVVYQKPLDQWDYEELQAGRPRAADGSFKGRRPRWISPMVLEEAQRRLASVSKTELGMHAGAAIQVMADLMKHSRVDMVRFQSARYVLDQIIGMPSARVEVSTNNVLQNVLADVMVNPDGGIANDDEDIMDAEIIEDEDDEE